jgi:hypothetical protein
MTFERPTRDRNSRFQTLQQSKTLEDFFMRLKGHCAAHHADNNKHLTLLPSSITNNKIARCIVNNFAYQVTYNEIKESCLRGFGKLFDYWFEKDITLAIGNNNIMASARRSFTITGYQTPKPLNRDQRPAYSH